MEGVFRKWHILAYLFMVIFLPLFWSESFKRAIEEADLVAEEADLDDVANPAGVVGEDEADLVGEVVDR